MNSKVLAFGAQKRFQGERERRTNQVSRSQIGRSDVAFHWLCPALCFSCLLAHVFQAMHGSAQNQTAWLYAVFQFAKQLRKCSFISPSFFFCSCSSPAKSNSERYRYRISFRPLGQIQALKDGFFLLCLINFHSPKVKLCGRTARFSAGLHCQDQKGAAQCQMGGYLASRLLKHCSRTFDRVTDSLIFNMDCVSNGLG